MAIQAVAKNTRLVTTLALGLLALAGCAQQRIAEAGAEVNKQVAECQSQYPGTPLTAPHSLDRLNCEMSSLRNLLAVSGTPADLADLYVANMAQVSADIDAGRMTKEQATIKLAELRVQLNQIAADRNRANTLAALAVLSAMPQPQYQPVPAYQIPIPQSHSFSCYTIGNMTNCN